jgi:hypothetical protein
MSDGQGSRLGGVELSTRAQRFLHLLLLLVVSLESTSKSMIKSKKHMLANSPLVAARGWVALVA